MSAVLLIMSAFTAEPVPGMSFLCVVDCDYIIASLFIQPFSGRSFTDKIIIISYSRPIPFIPTLISKTKTNTQH